MKTTKPSPVVAELKFLIELLMKERRLVAESERLDQLGPKLEVEERQFTERISFDDAAQLESLSQFRIKRELIPLKQKQLEEAIVQIREKIGAEFRERVMDYQRMVGAATRSAESKVVAKLDKIAGGQTPFTARCAATAPVLQPFFAFQAAATTGSLLDGTGPASASERLIEAWQEFLAAPPTLPAFFDKNDPPV